MNIYRLYAIFFLGCMLSISFSKKPLLSTEKVDVEHSLSIDQLCSLSITNTWREFQIKASNPYHQEKWAWMWSLTLKSKKALKLRQLNLQWHGKKIDAICASLYQKPTKEKLLIPIEKNLICDGIWNTIKQQLTFNLNEKIIATNKYYVVLNFPKNLEPIIKTGTFAIPKNNSIKITPCHT